MPVAETGEHSALLAAWSTACAQGSVSIGDAVAAVTGLDEPHVVEPGSVAALANVADLTGLLADVRRRRAGLRLVLPVPGDPRGLPGPGEFTDAALRAGEAVRLQSGDGDGYGLVPLVSRHGSESDGFAVLVTWRAFAADTAVSGPLGSRRAAERDLHDALRAGTAALTRLDVARLAPEAAAQLAGLRDARGPATRLPAAHPAAGRLLWEQAERLARILDIAAADDGAAVDRTAMIERRDLLRSLAAAARQAKVAAVNAAIDLSD
jgi:hypothetical protein